jgi:uncharacterized protein YcgI (DUF1989 family)
MRSPRPGTAAPVDADARRAAPPVICYPVETLPSADLAIYAAARENLRPMATITHDTLDWYGVDDFGGSVHDVIGTRCDPYTHRLLTGGTYHYCCHSNLTRALAAETGLALAEAEDHVHDVLNVFMCSGFTPDTRQYFMKASPVRPGDYLEFFAEIDLLGALSACPGGDCSVEHSSDTATCYPLRIEVLRPAPGTLAGWTPPAPNTYDRTHGQR